MSCRTMVLMRYAMSERETKHKESTQNKTLFETLKSVFKKVREFKFS